MIVNEGLCSDVRGTYQVGKRDCTTDFIREREEERERREERRGEERGEGRERGT